jgi:predicted secreted protein
MSKLGLTKRVFAFRFLALASVLALACKTSPETVPMGASAPTVAATPPPPPNTGPAPASSAAPLRTYDMSTTSIDAKVGEAFNIAVSSNITVPMKWRFDPIDEKILAGGDDKYVQDPPPDCPACMGYGGTRIFSFAATGPGSVKLHFTYRPLNDAQGPVQKELNIAVTVH